MKTALICILLYALLIMVLAMSISYFRVRTKKGIGSTDDPNHILNRLIMAHRNNCEYFPVLTVAMLTLANYSPLRWVGGLFYLVLLGRVMYTIGVLTQPLNRVLILRSGGMILTYLTGTSMLVLSLYYVLQF